MTTKEETHMAKNATSSLSPRSSSSNRPATEDPSDKEKPPDVENPEYLTGLKLFLMLLSLLIVVLLIAIDISIVSTALPRITDTFDTIADQGWYATGFTLANCTLQPMSGKIYTFFPMKPSFILFVAVFELGSLLCATSVSSTMFIIGRVVAGIGGSGLVNGALSILALIGPPDKRPMFMGLVMSVASAGQLVGPLIGGALTQNVTWRWCFYLNVPCGAVAIAFLALIRFPDNAASRKAFHRKTIVKDFDIVGFLLFVPAVVMCLMALQWGGVRYAWSSATVIGLLVGFLVLLMPLGWWEYRQGLDAMFPIPLLRQRYFYCANATSFLAGGALLILLYYLPLWFQTVKVASPFQSAINILPSIIAQILVSVCVGVLVPRVIQYLTPFALFGAVLNAAGSGALTSLRPGTSTAEWIGFQILSGAGRGMYMQIPVQTVQQHAAKQEMAIATAVCSFFQFFGGAFFSSLGQTTFQNLLKSSLRHSAPGLDPALVVDSGATDVQGLVPAQYSDGVRFAYNNALRLTFYLSVGAAVASFFTSFGLGMKKVERKAKAESKDAEKAPANKPKSTE